MPDGNKGGYPKEWEGKSLSSLKNEDGTYGKNHSSEEEVELFTYVMRSVFGNIQNEMFKQLAKWGVQNHPSFRIDYSQRLVPIAADANNWIPSEEDAKRLCETRHAQGTGTWADILLEELAEAMGASYRMQDPTGFSVPYPEGTPEVLGLNPEEDKNVTQAILDAGCDDVYYEVLQTAAVACAWLTAILLGRNRNAAEKELEQHKAEQAAYRKMVDQVRNLMRPSGERASDMMAVEAEDGEYTPGGYI